MKKIKILTLFVFSLVPYITIFLANHPNLFIPQALYSLDFIVVDVILFVMAKSLLKVNEENEEYLKNDMNIKGIIHASFNIHYWICYCAIGLSYCNMHLLSDNYCKVNNNLLKRLKDVIPLILYVSSII